MSTHVGVVDSPECNLRGHLARTVPRGHAVAACYEGAWALVGAVALHLGAPVHLIDDLVFSGQTRRYRS